MECVESWRFDPAIKDGQPIAAEMNIESAFNLSIFTKPYLFLSVFIRGKVFGFFSAMPRQPACFFCAILHSKQY